jgi:hypothetical protein
MSKIKKLKNDMKIIHIVDGKEVTCMFNQCLDKFEYSKHSITRTPRWNSYGPITSETFFWICKECGAKVNAKGDRSKSYKSYLDAVGRDSDSEFDNV